MAGSSKLLAVAALLVLLLPLPVGAAETEVGWRLPFLRADGVEWPVRPTRPLLLPEWETRPIADEEFQEKDIAWLEPRGPAYPDVTALLRGLAGEVRVADGEVTFRGPAEEGKRFERLLAAVRAGFSRRALIEVEVTRPAAPPVIALAGEAPLGSLLVADSREERSYPAGLDLDCKAACAVMKPVRVGPALIASAVRAGERYTLRLSLHLSQVVGVVRFERERLTLVAPEIEFTSLSVEVPAAPGEWETIRIGEVAIAYRVTPLPSPAPPAGTRVYRLGGTTPLFAADRPPEPGLVPLEPSRPEAESDPVESVRIPSAWCKGLGEQVRLVLVRPGLVVAEGEEAALARLDRTVETWWREQHPALRLVLEDPSERIDSPLAASARLVLLTGRIDPVVEDIEVEVCESLARCGPRLGGLFTGRTLTVSFAEDGVLCMTKAHAPTPPIRPRVIRIAIETQDDRRRERTPASDWGLPVERSSRVCRTDEVREWRKR